MTAFEEHVTDALSGVRLTFSRTERVEDLAHYRIRFPVDLDGVPAMRTIEFDRHGNRTGAGIEPQGQRCDVPEEM